MWLMNKVINPLVRLVLRSPLHGMLSSTLLLITYRGRKTGREYNLPVQYARDERYIYILPGMPEKKTWWRNFYEVMPVSLTLQGKQISGQAQLLDPQVDPAIITQALVVYLQRFPALARTHQVRRDEQGGFQPDDLRQAASRVHIIRVTLNEG